MIVLTDHAVQQFCTRFSRDMSAEDARELLEREIPRANRLRERSAKGDTMWHLPCGAYLVTKRDGRNDIVVTVLAEATTSKRRRHRPLNECRPPDGEEDADATEED